MAYWQLFYHFVWPTHDYHLLLTDEQAPEVHALIRRRVQSLGGTLYAVGGMADHVHIAVAVPPQIAVSVFVGQVKSWTSGRLNSRKAFPERFAWHESYGVATFDRGRLPNVMAYVNEQARHHAENTAIPALERMHGEPPAITQEPYQRVYIDNRAWLDEMLALDARVFD